MKKYVYGWLWATTMTELMEKIECLDPYEGGRVISVFYSNASETYIAVVERVVGNE